jgi:hypothetical protein
MTTMTETHRRELDARTGDGLEVRLLWPAGSADVQVEIVDSRRGELVVFEVPGPLALDAFRHPFAYAARAGALRDEEPAHETLAAA